MILFVVALAPEAAPLVRRYRMEPEEGGFRWYRSEKEALVVSGMGKLAAAAATSYLHARTGETLHSAWLNVGVAGHRDRAVGDVLLAHTVTDVATGERLHPTRLDGPPLDAVEVKTVDRPERVFNPSAARAIGESRSEKPWGWGPAALIDVFNPSAARAIGESRAALSPSAGRAERVPERERAERGERRALIEEKPWGWGPTALREDLASDAAYDMEAFGFCRTALRFANSELVQSIKIVSDNRNTTTTEWSAARAQELVEKALPRIVAAADHLRELSSELDGNAREPEVGALLASFQARFHLTATEARKLRRLLLRWRALDPEGPRTKDAFEDATRASEMLRRLESRLDALAMERPL